MIYPQIDKQQALRQLALLGFDKEKIYLRFFFPSSHPQKSRDSGRKLDSLNWKQIESYQRQGRGAYLVVNGGGHKNENVSVGRAIFYEHDHLDKNLQIELWRELSLPEPTFQIDTGGKSIHSYWVFSEPIPINQWVQLQKDLLEYSDADRSIKNPARVMRLAGAWHISYDAEGNLITHQSRIIFDSETKYSYEELRAIIPSDEEARGHQNTQPEDFALKNNNNNLGYSAGSHVESEGNYHQPESASASVPQQLPSHPDQIGIPIPEPIPLIQCCRKEVREWIATGVAQGNGRNDISIEVGLELIGVENYLRSIGQTYKSSGEQLFHEYCTRSGMSEKEEQERWNWCADKMPQPSCSGDGISNCLKGWYWREHIKPLRETLGNSKPENNNYRLPAKQNKSREEVIEAIDAILDENLPQSERLVALLQLSQQLYNYSFSQIKNIALEREEERLNQDYLEERKQELEQLEAWESEEYNPFADLFFNNPQVALAFDELCRANQKIQPQYFLSLLSVVSSLLGVEVEVKVPVLGNFRSNLNIAMVGESGEGKSIVSKILLSPIYQLQQKILDQHQREKETFEQALEHWETQHPDHRGPKPRAEDYITTTPAPIVINEYSREGIVRNHAENPNGLLIHQEELVSIQRSQNMYRQGKGDDRQFINNLYDGGTISRVLKSERTIIPKTCVSILGGVQPEIILKEMGDLSDPDGQWARYNFITGKEKRVYTRFDQKQVDVSGLLYDLYLRAFNTSNIQCQIDGAGLKIYEGYINQLEEKRWSTLQPALRAVLSKAVGEVARIALVLHAMDCLLKCQPITPLIPAVAIKKAIKIKNYFLRQMQILRTWGNGDSNHENGKAAAYRDIQKIAKRIGKTHKYLTTRMVQQARCGVLKNKVASQIAELFQELADMGKATLTKVKRSIALVIDDLLLLESGDNGSPPPSGGGGGEPPPPPVPSPPTPTAAEPTREDQGQRRTQGYSTVESNLKTPTFTTILTNFLPFGIQIGQWSYNLQNTLDDGFHYLSNFALDLSHALFTPSHNDVDHQSTCTEIEAVELSEIEPEPQSHEKLQNSAAFVDYSLFTPTPSDPVIRECLCEEKKEPVRLQLGARIFKGPGYFAIDGQFYIDLTSNLSLLVPQKYMDLVEFLNYTSLKEEKSQDGDPGWRQRSSSSPPDVGFNPNLSYS